MGDVWLAEDPRLHRQVAVKTLPIRNQGDREFSLRFEREAQAAAALNHPHIIPIHDYGEQPLSNGEIITYIVMPYISGGSLADRIVQYATNQTKMPEQEAIAYLSQVADAIDYAHTQGIIHRDIKPANMLLRNDNWLLLADFGIARILSSAEQLTQGGLGFGTAEYMAPEQAQGRAEAASDNYSLAVIAYQFFTGRLPFKADTSYAITIQHMTMPPPSPRQFNPSLSPALEQALLRGLAKQPADRPPSARAFVAELQRCLASAPYEATYVSTTPELPRTSGAYSSERSTDASRIMDSGKMHDKTAAISRRRLLIGGSAALVVVGGGLGAWALVNTLHPSPVPSPVQHATPQPSPTLDPMAPTIVLSRAHIKPANALAWSPKANVFVSVADSDNLLLWDMQQLQQAMSSSNPKLTFNAQQSISGGSEMQLAWSPDGSRLAVANTGKTSLADTFNNQTIDIYTGDLGQNITTLTATNTLFFQGLGWVQGKMLAAVSRTSAPNDTNHYQLWAADTTKLRQKLTPTLLTGDLGGDLGDAHPPLLAVAPDGSTVAIALYDGVAVGHVGLVGGTPTWQPLTADLQFDKPNYEAYGVTWAPIGKVVGSFYNVNGSSLYFWNWPKSKSPVQILQANAEITTMAWCPAPANAQTYLVAAGTKDGNVIIWNYLKNTQPAGTLNSGGLNAEVLALAWSADGQWLAASYKDNDSTILIWKIPGRGF
jgi:serine/threonine protein kinase